MREVERERRRGKSPKIETYSGGEMEMQVDLKGGVGRERDR